MSYKKRGIDCWHPWRPPHPFRRMGKTDTYFITADANVKDETDLLYVSTKIPKVDKDYYYAINDYSWRNSIFFSVSCPRPKSCLISRGTTLTQSSMSARARTCSVHSLTFNRAGVPTGCHKKGNIYSNMHRHATAR